MANYKGHSLFNCLIALPLFLVAAYYFINSSTNHLLIFSGFFIYSSLFMSPDMDVANKIKLFSIRGLLTLPFRSYARIFKHRGISHHVLFGSLTRVLWLSLFACIIFYLSQYSIDKTTVLSFAKAYKVEILYGFMGIFLSDCSHVFLDKVGSLKR